MNWGCPTCRRLHVGLRFFWLVPQASVLNFPSTPFIPLDLSLLLTDVQICGTVARVISDKPRWVLSLNFLYLLCFLPLAHSFSLFALFFRPPSFVFNNFRTLSAKHPGWHTSLCGNRIFVVAEPNILWSAKYRDSIYGRTNQLPHRLFVTPGAMRMNVKTRELREKQFVRI